MNKKKLALSAAGAGMLVFVLNLLAEWIINGRLVTADYHISLVAAVFTAAVIALLFAIRGKNSR